MRKPDHGLSKTDLEIFSAQLLSEAIEKAWLWKHSLEDDNRYELQDSILDTLVSVYMLGMWIESNLEGEVEESQEEDFD